MQVLNFLVLYSRDPELLAERSEEQAGTKAWGRILVRLVVFLGPLAIQLMAGLDERGGWSPPVPPWLQYLGLAVALPAALLGLWAMATNHFFSSTIRIQQERGHYVVTGVPYRFVRHSGYSGGLLFDLATPLILASWWAFIPVLITVGLIALRTWLEDRTLQNELGGYRGYAQQMRFRLLPGIW